MRSSMIMAGPTPAELSTPADWAVPIIVAGGSLLVAIVAWSFVATRDLRDPARDIRQAWRPSWRAVRLPLEAVIVGVSVLIATWWGWLADAYDYPAAITLHQAVTVSCAITCVAAFALVGLVYIRSGQRLLVFAVLGMAAWAVAGVSAIVSSVTGSPPLWTIAVLIGALPLVLAGLSTFHGQGFDGTPATIDRAEHRDTLAATTATVTSVAVITLGLPLDQTPGPEPMSTLLVVVLIALFALRESVNAYFRVQLTRRLYYQAVHDQLTGLPNRRGLAEAISGVDPAVPWVVLVLDLDGFERVNEELGHPAGDALLVAVAHSLAEQCRAPRVVARLGGDEFAVLSAGDLESGRRLALGLRGAVRDAVRDTTPGIPVTASIGVGRLPAAAEPEDPAATQLPLAVEETFQSFAAVAEASAALRAAKSDGHDRIEVYAGRTERSRRRRLAVERRLRATLADEQLTASAIQVHLQPLVRLDLDATAAAAATSDSATTAAAPAAVVYGFEALARWTDAELGAVAPSEFIPLAEQTGMIVPLGAHLVRTTLLEAARHGYFDTNLSLAINISALQLRAPGFAEFVLQLVGECRADPGSITLELTEAVLLDEDDAGLPALERLTAAGLRLGIDDFGTGHAALAYLRRLPLDVLKIDRSLTTAALRDPPSLAVVKGVIGLAGRLGITVVMEGIEDAESADLCRRLGAQVGQGWFFGLPGSWADAGDVDGLLALALAPDHPVADLDAERVR